jgi:hypothetical protein
MVQPTPLEATAPRAKDAAAVVDLILKGEREAVLTDHAACESGLHDCRVFDPSRRSLPIA